MQVRVRDDIWDRHWCSGASRRVEALARKMAPVIDEARARGMQIIHAPSKTIEFYKDWPQRQRIARIVRIDPPAPLGLVDPPLPIDDRDGGCDTGDASYKAWTRAIATLSMGAADVISYDGSQILQLLAGARHTQPAGDGRTREHVRAEPLVRHQGNDQLGNR